MIAVVTCLFKSGNPQLIENYRAISILVAFSKILEKIVVTQLMDYFVCNAYFTPSQGFLRGLSTADAIMCIVDYIYIYIIYNSFDNGECTVAVFLDFAKAFDSLDRNVLFAKLEYYEIKGPLLYLIFVNDIVHCSSILKFTMYADDTCVYFSDRNAVNGVEIINRELVLVTKWIRANRLTLNMDKCHYIVFHRHKRSLPNLLPQVEIENFEIEKCSSTKYLGVHLDVTIRWSVHINSIIRKISKFVPILYNIRSCLDRTSLKLLYNCLIYLFLIYFKLPCLGSCK